MIYFENTWCQKCGHKLGFDSQTMQLQTLEPTAGETFTIYGQPGVTYRYCGNQNHGVCNWLVPANDGLVFCAACSLNKTIPNIGINNNLLHWRKLETAKHRLVYSLMRLNIMPVDGGFQPPLQFEFLENAASGRVMTGHENGLITINIEEADDVVREQVRSNMGEPYRALLGHLRHEVGHYYWDILIRNTRHIQDYRNLFGDESRDYSQSLSAYYTNGPQQNWQLQHISSYASAHPWEDWAETWAHYMHMLDTLETGYSFGLDIHPRAGKENPETVATLDIDPYVTRDFKQIVNRWLPFTYAMNSINRSMGHVDLYPFVMSTGIIKKLNFIHEVIWALKTPVQAADTATIQAVA